MLLLPTCCLLLVHLQVLKNVSGTINSTASDVQKTVNKVGAECTEWGCGGASYTFGVSACMHMLQGARVPERSQGCSTSPMEHLQSCLRASASSYELC